MSGPRQESHPETPPFRTAAIEYHRRPSDEEGRPLQVTPPWIGLLYRLLITGGLVAFALLGAAPLSEFATGPAVVRLTASSEVHAETSGILEEILVTPGARVEAGQLLARLEGSRHEAELDKVRRQFELLLVDRLRTPRVRSVPGLGNAHEEVRLAEKNLDRLELRAPHAGVVGGVLVREGQAIEPGQLAFSVLSEAAGGAPTVVGLLPGRYRPLLEPGMSMQLRWSGYRAARQELIIEHVSASVVSAAEIRAIAGPIAGGLRDGGGYTVVQARLPSTRFQAAGQSYEVSDGLLGMAEVAVRTRRVASLLLPWTQDPTEGF